MYLECNHLADFLDGKLSPSDCGRFEDHVATCQQCARLIDAQSDLCSDVIDLGIARADALIELPKDLEGRIHLALADDARCVKPAATQNVRLGMLSIALLASLCAALIGAWYGFGRRPAATFHQAYSGQETRSEQAANRALEGSDVQALVANASSKRREAKPEPVVFHPSLIARKGFMVVEQSSGDDEIPFFWVVPTTLDHSPNISSF